jgi:hypothetical protein
MVINILVLNFECGGAAQAVLAVVLTVALALLAVDDGISIKYL